MTILSQLEVAVIVRDDDDDDAHDGDDGDDSQYNDDSDRDNSDTDNDDDDCDHSGLALMGTTNAALSLRRFTQTSFNFRFNSALPPPVPVVSPPLTPISRKSSLSIG
uniref:Uncharacterized protein n=1 Tax=Setaria digitata TaxID=48799 RepID=A0A915PGP9_9BILA